MRNLIVILCAILAGCDTLDSPTSSSKAALRTGLYETKQNLSVDGTFIAFVYQIHLQDGTYQASGFANETEAWQEKGSWKVSGDSLKTTERLSREINDAGGWGPWTSDADGSAPIRNVTATSFQRYVKANDLPEGIEGASAGWMTYNRIGD